MSEHKFWGVNEANAIEALRTQLTAAQARVAELELQLGATDASLAEWMACTDGLTADNARLRELLKTLVRLSEMGCGMGAALQEEIAKELNQ